LACIFGCAESGKDGSGWYAEEDAPGRYTDDSGEVIRCSTITSYNEGAPIGVSLAAPAVYDLGLEPVQTTTDLATGDFNGDGWVDTAIYVLADVVMVYLGSADGSVSEQLSLSEEWLIPRGVAAADVDGDGIDDVLIGNTPYYLDGDSQGTVSVHFGGEGFPSEPVLLRNMLGYAASLTAGDFDGDGLIDIASESAGVGFAIYYNEGDRTFAEAVHFGFASSFKDIHAADLDRDGRDDIVGVGILGGVTMALAEDDRSFAEPLVFAASLIPTPHPFLDVGDLDGNGGPDIATNVWGGEVWVLWNDGHAEFELGRYCTSLSDVPDTSPFAVSIADFDGDATLDLAVVNGATGTLGLLGGTRGVQSLRMPQLIGGGGSGAHMLGADINGDGRPDIVALADGGLSTRLNLD
jgi:hypothetical protein